MTDDILVRIEGGMGVLSLNRPKAIHALNRAMVDGMTEALLAWRNDPAIGAVIIDHSEGRGFCAGGDIAFLRNSALTDENIRQSLVRVNPICSITRGASSLTNFGPTRAADGAASMV